jgi:hypothetical protein
MGRKSNEALEENKIRLFKGDFHRLSSILAPRRVPTNVFIRHLVRKAITQIEARVNETARPVEIDADDIIRQST